MRIRHLSMYCCVKFDFIYLFRYLFIQSQMWVFQSVNWVFKYRSYMGLSITDEGLLVLISELGLQMQNWDCKYRYGSYNHRCGSFYQ